MKTWTKTPPTSDGYYWHRISPERKPEVVEVYSWKDNQGERFQNVCCELGTSLIQSFLQEFTQSEWHGLIQPPTT